MKRIFTFLAISIASLGYAQSPGNALNFDGANDMVVTTVPALFGNLTTNDFTFEAWVYPNATLFSRIIYAQFSTTSFATMSTGGTNNIYFYVVAGGTNYSIATTATLPFNQWTHVACRWTAATASPQVFFNGVLQAGAGGGTSSTGTNGLMTLGTRPGGAQYFNGSMDDIRVWSEARSQCEIQSNMNSEYIAVQPNLIAYYNCNQGIPGGPNAPFTTLPDINAAFNGTLTNFALSGPTSNWIASGALINSVGPYTISSSSSSNICQGDTLFFNGNPLTTAGNYSFTTTNIAGCDSIVNLTLSVIPLANTNISVASCINYFFNSTTLTMSGTYYDTLTAVTGCDSLVTLNLTINNPQNSSFSQTACDQYMFNSTLINSSGTYYDTLSTINGCDSVVTLNLTIHNAQTSSFSQTACDQYMFNSTLLSSSGTYYDTLSTVNGCDSVVTLNLTINNTQTSTISQTACNQYLFNSTMLTISGTYVDTMTASSGCDSIITLNLTINSANVGVNQAGTVLTANASGANYQWLDCNNSFAMIPGETNATFNTVVNGNYAVQIIQNGCTDTSTCFAINTFGLDPLISNTLTIYPNPTDGMLFIQSTEGNEMGYSQLMNINGEVLYTFQLINHQISSIDMSIYPSGIYFLRSLSNGEVVIKKIVKK